MLMLGFVIAQVIIFTVIIVVLKKLIFQDTTSAINRLNKIDGMNREKERVLAIKLDETEKYLQKKKSELEGDEKILKQEAQRAANQLHEDIVKKAKIEAEEIIKKAQESRGKIRAEALLEAEGKIIDFCREILGNVLSHLVQVQMNDQMIQEFLKELEEADLSNIGKDANKVEILSGRHVNEGTKAIIKSILDKKLGKPVEVDIKEDAQLMGGLILKFGTLVVDGSLAERIRENAEKLKDELNWKHSG